MESKIRKRYIVFRVDGPPIKDRNSVIKEIRRRSMAFGGNFYDDVKPWLTVFDGTYGVVRFDHRFKEGAIRLIEHLEFPEDRIIRSIGISGTIRKARKKYIGNASNQL